MAMRDGIRVNASNYLTVRRSDRTRPGDLPWSGRLWARIFADRYDRQVDSGVRVAAGSPLAAHCARLSSRRERRDLEQSMTNVMRDAGLIPGGRGGYPTRVPVRADAVRQSADLVADVVARLAGPLPVRRRGMARLRILLADGRGPLYRSGPGTFAAAMRGVLAAM